LAWTWVVCWATVIWILGGDGFSLAETSRTISPWLEFLIGDLDPATRFKIFLAIRKSAHFFEYAILAILTFRAALLAAPRNQLATAGWVALFLVATLATADEARQAFSSARSGSPYDVAIDVAGGLIAIVGLILITRRMRDPQALESAA
jgi:VanZ family protein